MAASDVHTCVYCVYYYACAIAAMSQMYFVLLVGDTQAPQSLPLIATRMGACMAAGHILGVVLLEHYVSSA